MDQGCTKEEGETEAVRTPALKAPPLCIRCKTKSANILIIRSTYCKECFDNFYEHRFKINLTRARTSEDKRKNLRILVAFSGGAASRSLLHLLQQMVFTTRKKIFIEFAVAFIDEGCALGLSSEQRQHNRDQISKIVESYRDKVPIFISNLEDVFSGVPPEVANLDDGEDKLEGEEVIPEKVLKDLLRGIPSLTSREDMIVYLRHQLLYRIALEQGYECVMKGDTATRLAIRTISETCKGRGFSVPLQVGHSDPRFQGVNFVQPLRDFLVKEVTYYNKLHNLETFFIPTMGTKLPPKSSINLLAEDFVAGLQADFSHTVHTILRTTEKLHAPPHIVKKQSDQDDSESSANATALPAAETVPVCLICHLSIAAQEILPTSVGFQQLEEFSNPATSGDWKRTICFPCRQHFCNQLATSGMQDLIRRFPHIKTSDL
eukprot:TRINITY_DN12647_c0_g1_i1.p1 TRINITY_DN12647_c0_g1~~TRINITY_DN12647_c0_g1_i1.p1  ORF type:complete len:433 (+),score=85.44 TRINITY_DN12647_c0_g1_i1:82-1380(+)